MNYEMGGTILCKTVKENDLGVTINANMKVSEQFCLDMHAETISVIL